MNGRKAKAIRNLVNGNPLRHDGYIDEGHRKVCRNPARRQYRLLKRNADEVFAK